MAEQQGSGLAAAESTVTPPPADVKGNIYASKTELLEWVNGLLYLQLTRLEQFASGAVYCQVLDAYFKDTIAIHKVNFYAITEYDAIANYKILQTGFTALKLTRDINVAKLSRGSVVDTLELLQYLYKYLLKKRTLDDYDAEQRRTLTMQGGTNAVPLPAWMISMDNHAPRARTSSGNWGGAQDPGSSVRSQARSTSARGAAAAAATHGNASFNATGAVSGRGTMTATGNTSGRGTSSTAAVGNTSGRGTSSSAAVGNTCGRGTLGATGSTSARAAAAVAAATSTQRRPCVPVRAPSAATGRGKLDRTEKMAPAHDDEERDGADVEVVHVVPHSEEVAAAPRPSLLDTAAATNTRLVVSDDALQRRPERPLSPNGRSLLDNALDVAQEAIANLTKSLTSLRELPGTLGCSTDSYSYRGKMCSLKDAVSTLVPHAGQLLEDVGRALDRRAVDEEAGELRARQLQLTQDLARLQPQLISASQQLSRACTGRPVSASLLLQLTQNQKQLTSTSSLDGSLRAVGTVHSAVVLRLHKESSAAAAAFLDATSIGGAVQQPAGASKGLKLGDDCMKRLRNGDIYRGRYLGARKNGEGVYCFTNQDVYEGEFKDDRMAGTGVYTFYPEGRYEGEWQGAVYAGAGCETFAKGSTYQGEYSGGLRAGWGTCRFHNGDYYEGQWAKGVREGVGMQQCMDDSNYIGDYQRGKRHGYGVYSFPNGDQYLGEYEDDIPTGYGVYVFGSGQKYEGRWEKGKKHGWSVYTVETGQRWAGSWVEGKPQWVQPLVEAGSEAAAALKTEEAANMTHAVAAAQMAQEAMKIASVRATDHWQPQGEVQQGLRGARARASAAASSGQAARGKAQALASRLDAAALLVEQGNKAAAGMTLVG